MHAIERLTAQLKRLETTCARIATPPPSVARLAAVFRRIEARLPRLAIPTQPGDTK